MVGDSGSELAPKQAIGLKLLILLVVLYSLLFSFFFFSSESCCCMEYAIALTKLTEPMEERMEQALFSPPLSKQRVEFAVHHIIKSRAATLVDINFL